MRNFHPFHPFQAGFIFHRSDAASSPCIRRDGFKGPSALQPFHILQVDDSQAATQVIPQHITPLTVAVDNPTRPERGQSSVALLVKEAGVPIMDGMLKPRSRPAQDHHLRHYFAVVPICNARLKVPKTDRDVLSLQVPEPVIIVHFRSKAMLLLRSRCFHDHRVSAGKEGGFDEISCPTTNVQLFESKFPISGQLTMELACELLRSDGVSPTTVEFPVGAILIQWFSVSQAADARNGAVWSRRRSVLPRGLYMVSAGSCPFTFPG